MKKIIGILWILLIGVVFYNIYIFANANNLTIVGALKEVIVILQMYIKDLGLYAGVVYILIYTVRPLVFFPTSILTPASAVLFGPALGWILTYIGENFSAVLAFFVGRYFGKNAVEKFKVLRKLDKSVATAPFITVLFLRMVPLFPFDFVNYGMGITKIKFKWYLSGTLLGVIPGLTAYIFLGTSITDPRYLIPTILFFAILISVSWYIKRKSSIVKQITDEQKEE